jgi:L-threonylcarbamoyladenylate synthase
MASIIRLISEAAGLIQKGSVVAFPTETVYGLGADATSSIACKKIYSLKQRPPSNPLIVHVASIEDAYEIGDFSDLAIKLATKFWPGPLTLVVKLKKTSGISSIVTAGLDTIALRIPNNKVALELIKTANVPIAAPSANISNYVSATSLDHVLNDFSDTKLSILIEENPEMKGLESTIVDTTLGSLVILRHGFILAEDIATVGNLIEVQHTVVKAPGMLLKHYSPKSKLRLNATEVMCNEVGIGFAEFEFDFNLSKKGDLYEAAANLYDILRKADQYAIKNNIAQIAIASIPDIGIGVAINDKLTRASK